MSESQGSSAPSSTPGSSTAQQQSAPTSSAAPGSVPTEAQIDATPGLTPTQKVEAKKMIKSLKLKIDGQEYNEELPFEMEDTPANRDYMSKQLQMSKVAQKRMGEKAQLEKEVTQFIELMKKDPRKALNNFGVDVKKLAAEVVEEEIANSQKSPEQLQIEQYQRELAEIKEKQKQEQEEYTKKEFERAQEQAYISYENQMSEALEGSELPKSPYVVKKIADYMLLGVQNGIDVTAKDVLPLVQEEIINDIKAMAQAMPAETLEKLFGGDIMKKIRKSNVAKAKAGGAAVGAKAQIKDVGAIKVETPNVPAKKQTVKQFFGI